MKTNGSGEYYYNKGILTGFAVAIEIAEESSDIPDFITRMRKKLRGDK